MVNNYWVKYVREEHAKHLEKSLVAAGYRIKSDWIGTKSIDITIGRYYENVEYIYQCRGIKRRD